MKRSNVILGAVFCLGCAFSINSFAQSVSAYGSTLASAEAHVAQKAKQLGSDHYKVTSARTHAGHVYMTAEVE